jgi:hypothetical protein
MPGRAIRGDAPATETIVFWNRLSVRIHLEEKRREIPVGATA